MRIEGPLFQKLTGIKNLNRVSPAEDKKPITGTDKASVSNKAQLYQVLLNKVKEIPDIRDAERIESLARAIAVGNYAVDAQKIAAKLLKGRE